MFDRSQYTQPTSSVNNPGLVPGSQHHIPHILARDLSSTITATHSHVIQTAAPLNCSSDSVVVDETAQAVSSNRRVTGAGGSSSKMLSLSSFRLPKKINIQPLGQGFPHGLRQHWEPSTPVFENFIFPSHEISSAHFDQATRQTIYIASLEAHIESLITCYERLGYAPISIDRLQELQNLDFETLKTMAVCLQDRVKAYRQELIELDVAKN
ncbi:hypothetical protein CVT26_000583 [Gymnopilus dilepis]|uniref:Uncharacterized protein n=1 Tax=Gymnopilus dilepis TaxID=231916 RepID=A0A409VHC9_9AGAR|nr:hypothetical protein CVT26_000583 [Gymnopilus dilepis]